MKYVIIALILSMLFIPTVTLSEIIVIESSPSIDTIIENVNFTTARNVNGHYNFYADKTTGKVTLSTGKDFIEFRPDSLKAGNTVLRNTNIFSTILSGNTLTYASMFGSGINVKYELQPNMLKEYITIDSRSRLPLTMAGNIELNYSLKMTGTGFQISQPFITDSRENSIDLPYTKTNSTLTIRIPASWLSTASYPVVIDPTVTYSVPGTSAYAETAGCIVGAEFCEYSYTCSATTFGTKPTTSLLEPTCGDYGLGCPASPDGRVENDFYYAFNVSNITGNVTVSANLTVWFTAPNAGSMVYCTHVTSNSTQCSPTDTNDSYPQPAGKTGLNKLIFNVTNHVNLTYPIIWFAIYGTAITNVNRPQVNATLTINYSISVTNKSPYIHNITGPSEVQYNSSDEYIFSGIGCDPDGIANIANATFTFNVMNYTPTTTAYNSTCNNYTRLIGYQQPGTYPYSWLINDSYGIYGNATGTLSVLYTNTQQGRNTGAPQPPTPLPAAEITGEAPIIAAIKGLPESGKLIIFITAVLIIGTEIRSRRSRKARVIQVKAIKKRKKHRLMLLKRRKKQEEEESEDNEL